MSLFSIFSSPSKNNKNNENGNAFVFILIAIALLAALTFSLTRSEQEGGKSGDKAQMKIQVNQLLRTAKNMQFAIEKMKIQNGTSENDISFHSEMWGNNDYQHNPAQPEENRIFSPKGGAVNFPTIPPLASKTTSKIAFYGDFAVDNIGSPNSELTFVIEDIDRNFCLYTNKELGITNPSNQPPDDKLGTAGTPFNGSYTTRGGDAQIGNVITALKGKKTACIKDSSGKLIFYHVLIER